ncbi:MAG: hypothetical protein WED82_02120 [Balneolales bacterium]
MIPELLLSFFLGTAVFIGSVMLLLRLTVFSHVKRATKEANADLIVWFMYKEKWDGSPNSILYAWRTVLFDLKNQKAPAAQIEAAERAVKYYERQLTKTHWMIGSKSKPWKKATIGGKHA